MENYYEATGTRISRIVLIKEGSFLVYNDRYRIKYHHQKTFVLIWTVCKTMTQNKEYQSLGGIPLDDLQNLCQLEGLKISQDAINTLWHDEVEFRRHPEMIFSMFEITDLKNGTILTKMNPGFLVNILTLVFGKVRPSEFSKFHRNTKLFTIFAEPEQILMFMTFREAQSHGIQPSGRSDITKFRKDKDELGIIYWRHIMSVDNRGSASSTVAIKFVNLSPIPILHHTLPFWSDGFEQPRSRKFTAFTEDGTKFNTDLIIGKGEKSKKVEPLVLFPYPVEKGKTIEFSYSYFAKNYFKQGIEHFDCYFNHPHMEYFIDIQFSKAWKISNPIVFIDDKDEDIFQVELINSQHIKWTRYFPRVGSRYNIRFNLTKNNR
jgi:hypothetical protein